jgi:hypothetical protein
MYGSARAAPYTDENVAPLVKHEREAKITDFVSADIACLPGPEISKNSEIFFTPSEKIKLILFYKKNKFFL